MSRSCTVVIGFCLILQLAHPQRSFATLQDELDDQNQSAEKLVNGLTETLTSIHSVYCEFTQVVKTGDKSTSTKRLRYARFDDKWHMTEFSIEDDKVNSKESVVCFDGETVYSYFVTRSPDGKLRDGVVQIQMNYSREPPIVSPEYRIGMRLNDLRQSIPAVCQTNKATILPSDVKDTSDKFRWKLGCIHHCKTP